MTGLCAIYKHPYKGFRNPFYPAFTCCILQLKVHEVEQIQVAVKLNGGQLKQKKEGQFHRCAKKESSGTKHVNSCTETTQGNDTACRKKQGINQCAEPLKTNIRDPETSTKQTFASIMQPYLQCTCRLQFQGAAWLLNSCSSRLQ